MKPAPVILCSTILTALIALLALTAGCTQEAPAPMPGVFIVYGSDKGDLSYTDSAYQGILAAEENYAFAVREFVPRDYGEIPGILAAAASTERPGLIITVGFQYADFTRELAEKYPGIRFLAIDQAGIGSENIRSYHISSYGDSYLAGVLAASATKSGRVGIIMGMQSDVLDTFLDGYAAGARAVNRSVVVDAGYVHRDDVSGFYDPVAAGQVASGMYANGTDVIFTCAGFSNTGAFDAARNATGRYIIGTDTDQAYLGPDFVLASAVKRVDRVVYAGIGDYLNGTFTGGDRVVGLEDGITGIAYNPAFATFEANVSAQESQAQAEEDAYEQAATGITAPATTAASAITGKTELTG